MLAHIVADALQVGFVGWYWRRSLQFMRGRCSLFCATYATGVRAEEVMAEHRQRCHPPLEGGT